MGFYSSASLPAPAESSWLHRAAILMIESSAGTNIMPERFTETLRAASEPGWSHAVGHRFVNELFTGAMPDAVMARYLIQDHRFLARFLTLLRAVLASADTFAARLRFGRFIGMVSSEENTYFLRAFEALGVPEVRRAADPDTQATAGFKTIMRDAAETRSYAATLTVLVVAEWLYLDWASRAPKPLSDNFVHAEWITLHDNPDFRGFVDFLRAELDRVGPAQADLCRDFFRRAVALELSFFKPAYAE
jgi:thiaminase/transcriptional activator TenA